jgi:hypothetical protein
MQGEIELAAGDPAAARAHYEAALAIAAPAGMRALEAHAWRGLARVAEAVGASEEAARWRAAATARYAELGMVAPPG